MEKIQIDLEGRIKEIQEEVLPDYRERIEAYCQGNGVGLVQLAFGLPNDNETLVIELQNVSEKDENFWTSLNDILIDPTSRRYFDSVEQVAICYEDGGETITRMIGREMCGNGAEVLGEYVRKTRGKKGGSKFKMDIEGDIRTFTSSVVKDDRNIIGIPGLIKDLERVDGDTWRVVLDGINYVVEVISSDPNVVLGELDQLESEALISGAKQAISEQKFEGAAGKVDLYIGEDGKASIVPTIIVPGISEMVERGCFTGTVSAAVVLENLGLAERGKPIEVLQRSGQTYVAYLPKKDGGIVAMANQTNLVFERGLKWKT